MKPYLPLVCLLATLQVAHAEPPMTKQQIDALPQDKVAAIKTGCDTKWRNDFEMRIYCEDKQYKALTQLIQRNGPVPSKPEPWQNKLSGECTEQVLKNAATPECKAEGERWSAELKAKLADPAFVQHLLDFDRTE